MDQQTPASILNNAGMINSQYLLQLLDAYGAASPVNRPIPEALTTSYTAQTALNSPSLDSQQYDSSMRSGSVHILAPAPRINNSIATSHVLVPRRKIQRLRAKLEAKHNEILVLRAALALALSGMGAVGV